MACGRRSIGNTRANRSASSTPAAGDLRRQRRRGPGVHDVGLADEAARHAALVGACSPAARRSTDRSAAAPRRAASGCVVVELAVGVERIPDRERHAEEPLAADAPVAVQAARPSSRSAPHVVRVPAAARRRARAAPSRTASRAPLRMYHWRLVTISSGRSPFSKNFTACVIGRGSPIEVARPRAAARRSRALRLRDGGLARRARRSAAARAASRDSQPAAPRDRRSGRRGRSSRASGSVSSRHQITSVRSPNVQIIGDAAALVRLGQRVRERPAPSTPNSGVRHRRCRTAAGSARRRGARRAPRRPASSSGRVVSMSIARAVRRVEARRGGRRRAARGPRARPGRRRCWKSTSHSVGASSLVRLAAGEVAQERRAARRAARSAPIVA